MQAPREGSELFAATSGNWTMRVERCEDGSTLAAAARLHGGASRQTRPCTGAAALAAWRETGQDINREGRCLHFSAFPLCAPRCRWWLLNAGCGARRREAWPSGGAHGFQGGIGRGQRRQGCSPQRGWRCGRAFSMPFLAAAAQPLSGHGLAAAAGPAGGGRWPPGVWLPESHCIKIGAFAATIRFGRGAHAAAAAEGGDADWHS